MKSLATLSTFLIGSLMLLAAVSPALALANPIMTPGMRAGDLSGSSWYSTNWSGYAVTGSSGSVTSVQGSWKVPQVSAGASKTTAYYSSFWVGIDGFNSGTVEQIGTDSDIVGTTASYYAWYEFYPSAMVQITKLKISPGDIISASVTYTGSSGKSGFFGRSSSIFTVTITDINKTTSFATTGTVTNAARSSAEWIAEAPSSYRGVLPLANFGTVNFGNDYTQVAGTCFATVSGVTGTINSFGSAVQEIAMVTNKGVTKASPTGLSSDGTSFSIAWTSAGP